MVLAVALAAVITAFTIARQNANNTDDPVATKSYATGEFFAKVLSNSLTPLESRMGAVYDSAVNTQKRLDPQKDTKASILAGRGTVITLKNGAWFILADGQVSNSRSDGRILDVSEGEALADAGIEIGHRYVVAPEASLQLKVQRLSTLIMAGPVEIAEGKSDYVDLNITDWYYDAVADLIEQGVMNGTSETTFSPDLAVSRMSAVVIACMISQLKEEGAITLKAASGESWYRPYLEYAIENKILTGSVGDYPWEEMKVPISRGEIARYLSRAVPKTDLKEINDIKRGQITDVPSNHQYFSEIYTLCRAGVFSGSPDGSFQPDAQITRAQIAIVADCLLNPEMRVKQ